MIRLTCAARNAAKQNANCANGWLGRMKKRISSGSWATSEAVASFGGFWITQECSVRRSTPTRWQCHSPKVTGTTDFAFFP